ncbi:MAG: hypothetical protein ACXU8N_16725 [Telluria sp.]
MERTSDLHQRSARPDLTSAHRAAQEPASQILGRLERGRYEGSAPRWLASGLAAAGMLLLMVVWLAWTNAHTVRPLPKAPAPPVAQGEPIGKKPLVVFESPGGTGSAPAAPSPIPAVLALAQANVGALPPAPPGPVSRTAASPRPPVRTKALAARRPPARPSAPPLPEHGTEADPDVALISALRKAAE